MVYWKMKRAENNENIEMPIYGNAASNTYFIHIAGDVDCLGLLTDNHSWILIRFFVFLVFFFANN
jgi:hypothetical protein